MYVWAFLVQHPILLACSLEKRVIPRYKVLEILKSRRLLRQDSSLNVAMCYSNRQFLEKYIYGGSSQRLINLLVITVGYFIYEYWLETWSWNLGWETCSLRIIVCFTVSKVVWCVKSHWRLKGLHLWRILRS